jgi:hypothetical protein
MNRIMLTHYLAQAEEHVASGRRAIIRQRELILDLERDGQNTGEARRLLVKFEESLKLHVADRERLLEEQDRLSHKDRRRGATSPTAVLGLGSID